MTILRSCVPRPDVLKGGLTNEHFAAQLDSIVRGRADSTYGDPDSFFDITHPTAGLKELLRRTFGRVSGHQELGMQHGFIRSETSFGGGKTHGLIALYHLAKGARPSNLADFIDPQLIPPSCQIAALVGDSLDPVNGITTGSRTSHTLWGEIGIQLGDAAYAALEESDRQRTVPSKETLARAFAGVPTIIVIDEIAQYLRQLATAGSEDVRRLALAVPVFLKNLLELAAADRSVVVIITLATGKDAFNRETHELDELLKERLENLEVASKDVGSVLARFTQGASIVKPAVDLEIAEILKKRLFSRIDPAAAQAAADSFSEFYESLTKRAENLPDDANAHARYAERVKQSYPFHPELIRVLDQRLSTIPLFQRARGALRLVAEVVRGLWVDERDALVINVGDVYVRNPHVLNQLTIGLDRPQLEAVALTDFVGARSYASQVDAAHPFGEAELATRAATTVFLHSLDHGKADGVGRQDLILGTLRPGEAPDVMVQALNSLHDVAWYLDSEIGKYRFQVEPNPNAIIASVEQDLTRANVHLQMQHRVEEAFRSEAPIHVVAYPVGYQDVPDRPRQFQLVIMHPDSVTFRSGEPVPPALTEIVDRTGANAGIRHYRNGIGFLVADREELARFERLVRRDMAAKAIVDDPVRMTKFSEQVRKRVQDIADISRLEARVALTKAFKHLFIPGQDDKAARGGLRHEELPPAKQGDVMKQQTRVVLQRLNDMQKIMTKPVGVDYLRVKAWPRDRDRVSTEEIMNAFWRDHSLPLVFDPNNLVATIRKGVENGQWVYHDPKGNIILTDRNATGPIRIDNDTHLLQVQAARAAGLFVRPLEVEDVVAVLAGEPVLPFVAFHDRLGKRAGGDVPVDDAVRLLAEAGERVVVVDQDGRDLHVSDVTAGGVLDAQVMTRAAAAVRGSVVGVPAVATPKTVEYVGAFGPAYQQALNAVEDSWSGAGIRRMEVTATAEIETGFKPLKEMLGVVPKLPNQVTDVALRARMTFKSLDGLSEIEIKGSARDFQRVEDSILDVLRRANEIDGSVTVGLSFMGPVQVTDDVVEKIRRVLLTIQPGEVKVRLMPW